MSDLKVTKIIESKYPRRRYDSDGKSIPTYDSPYGESRVFLDFKGETIYDNLNNRRQRPNTVLKPLVREKLIEMGIDVDKLAWSQKAGCRSCPCSPGFIIKGNYGKDYYAIIEEYDTDYVPNAVTIVI